MGEIFLKAIIITAVLLFFAVPGYALKKLNMLGEGAKLTLSNILLYVCQPAMIVAAFAVFSDGDYAKIRAVSRVEILCNFALCAALSLAALGVMFLICKLVFIKSKNRAAADIYTFIAVFSNCGFLGVPFVQMFTDGDPLAVMYLMVFNLVFAVLVWTLGVYLITHNFKDVSAKKVLLNPTIIATAVALLLFFVPEINFFMFDAVKELGNIPSALSSMTAPVAMILVGVSLAEMPLKSLFTTAGVYVAGALRLVAAPIITFALAVLFRTVSAGYIDSLTAPTDYVFLAPVLAMIMSPASVVVALAERYDGEKELAAKAYVTNTLFSLITVPLLVMAVTELWKYVV